MPKTPLMLTKKALGVPEPPGNRAHQEEGKLSSSVSEDVSGIGERNFVAVSVGAVDVVEADSKLGNPLEGGPACGKDFGVDWVAEGCHEPIDARAELFKD